MSVVKVKYRYRASDGWWEASVQGFVAWADNLDTAIYTLGRALKPPSEPSQEALGAVAHAWFCHLTPEDIEYETI